MLLLLVYSLLDCIYLHSHSQTRSTSPCLWTINVTYYLVTCTSTANHLRVTMRVWYDGLIKWSVEVTNDWTLTKLFLQKWKTRTLNYSGYLYTVLLILFYNCQSGRWIECKLFRASTIKRCIERGRGTKTTILYHVVIGYWVFFILLFPSPIRHFLRNLKRREIIKLTINSPHLPLFHHLPDDFYLSSL